MTDNEKESPLEFPAKLDVKAMGLNTPDFEDLIQTIVAPHVTDQLFTVTKVESRAGKYVSVRIHFTATSRQQLERIYSDLRANERVLFAL